MKKLLSVLLIVSMLFLASAMLASCGHTCVFSDAWTGDATHHWHACEKEKCADAIIIGLPYNMDGTEGDRVIVTREFAEKLAEFTDIKIEFQDERLTTVQAERMLISGGVRRDKRKKVIDKVAATLILQAYLDKKNY